MDVTVSIETKATRFNIVRSTTLFTFGYPNLMLSLLQKLAFEKYLSAKQGQIPSGDQHLAERSTPRNFPLPRLLIRFGGKCFLLNKTSLKIDFDQTYFRGNIFSTKTNLRRKVFSMKYNFDKLEFR